MRHSTCPNSVVHLSALSVCVAALALPPALAEEPGQTPRPTPSQPIREPSEEELVRLDKDHPYFRQLESEGPFQHRGQPITDPKRWGKADAELKAYDYILGFAKRQPVERMRKYSVRDVPLENLFRPIKQDYLLELLHFEGKLSLVLAMKPTKDVKELEGVEELYEAWIYPRGSNKLVCVVVSELPDGIKPGENQTASVSFDAYFFRLFHYESRQPKDRADPDKKQWHTAPMFLGRTFEVLPPEPVEGTYSPTMLIGIASGLGLLAGVGLVMALWFRRGDRRVGTKARERIHQTVFFENNPSPVASEDRINE